MARGSKSSNSKSSSGKSDKGRSQAQHPRHLGRRHRHLQPVSCYTHGLMGYQTPNIDRIAKEGMMFTDSYGEQSCTAGRSSFITGQSVLRRVCPKSASRRRRSA